MARAGAQGLEDRKHFRVGGQPIQALDYVESRMRGDGEGDTGESWFTEQDVPALELSVKREPPASSSQRDTPRVGNLLREARRAGMGLAVANRSAARAENAPRT
jgi:hypothetical protein